MLKRLELHHVGPASQLEFELAPRLNLLTGDNGLGKTFILDVAWWALTQTWAGYPASPHRGEHLTPTISFRLKNDQGAFDSTSAYDFSSQFWSPPQKASKNSSLVIYARIDGSFSVWDPLRNSQRPHSTWPGTPPPQSAYHFAPQQVWDGLEPDGKVLCNGLVRDWATWQGRNDVPFHHLLRALEVLSPSERERLAPGELTRISLEDVRDMPTLRTSYGQEVPVVHASAGVKRIIALAYLLVWSWQEHVQANRLLHQGVTRQIIFLIDELESHLHPRWQRTILRSILGVMGALTREKVAVQVLSVTHSPLLLASLEPLFDPAKDALWNLDLEDQSVVLKKEPWRRRGDANSWLTSDVFDLTEPRSLEAEEALQQARALMSRKGVTHEEFNEVRQKLRASLSDVDPFWLHWGFWAQEAGLQK
ncbi:AAA family ATPase [Corallococcus sp. AS-1-6]|uniref:AAA family ATPase n=1 Tax=Corallococcus sp. AS-1-6 TaxID=2874599 RepID=UPI001CBE3C99|nr:ATP-binding protein [Corallococcus sp. AS-1-6]MBZ4375044.1 AAA family ATPase [Corallococcus sp. AS-1-6]